MERNGLPGRINYSNDEVGMLGFDMPLLQSTHPQNPPIPLQMNQQQMMSSSQHHLQQHERQTTNYIPYNNQNPNSNSNSNSNMSQNQHHRTKTQFTNSDEDEPSSANDHENSSFNNGKRKMGNNLSQWQRMKWTDDMVRLLILAVYYIGDEVSNEVGPEKKKPGSSGAPGGSGLMQKKGKWKSVSRAMIEKGFIVSPQQCEDKFNDLNKRYKRVNDILGKGTACNVVENQTLLETMDLAPKMKDEVRKLLNSKHLFFKEMCAYHKSCGHGHGGGSITSTIDAKVQLNPQQSHQQSCAHSGGIAPSSIDHYGSHKDDDEEDDEEDNEEEEGDEENGPRDMYYEGGGSRKSARGDGLVSRNSEALQQFSGEIMGMLRDSSKSACEKKQWMKIQLVKLEEQGLIFHYEALELEKQKFKWLKFSCKKEREMEKLKIENERKRLANERMLLLVKQKEIDLLGERNDPSCITS